MCRGNTEHCVSELPSVLLELRASLRDDTQISAEEMVFGEPIRLPGDFFEPMQRETCNNESFLKDLRSKIPNLAAVPKREMHLGKIFVHPYLQDCTHVFVRVDKVTKPLTQPYMGPFKVIGKKDKCYKIMQQDTQNNISIDRLKPAFTLNSTVEFPATTPNTASATVQVTIARESRDWDE